MGMFAYDSSSQVEWFWGNPYSYNDAFVINRNTGYTTPSSKNSPPGIGASAGTLFKIASSGNVGIGTTSPQATLHVEGNITGSGDININGTLTAQRKSFNIPHPTQPGKRLIYGVLEGPEHGVYVRGESKSDTVTLPEEWVGLIDETTISVQLTPIGSPDIYFYEKYENNTIKVGGPQQKHYFYYIQAMRKDIEPLITVQ